MTSFLLILHFTGLVMGFSATFANMVTMRLIASATPQEAAILRRVPPQMLRVSSWGVALLLVTGPMLVYSKHDGAWGSLPWAFWLKMLAVVALVAIFGFLHVNMARVRKGDAVAPARVQIFAPLASASAALALVFAVIAFV
jgi:hypothetical protein